MVLFEEDLTKLRIDVPVLMRANSISSGSRGSNDGRDECDRNGGKGESIGDEDRELEGSTV